MRFGFLLIVTLVTASLFPFSAHAMQISPLRETRVVAPGSVERFEITVTNNGSHKVTFVGEVEAFQIDPQKGTPVFGGYSRALEWFTYGPDITLAPGESKKMWFSLSVPAGAAPESFYLGLFAAEHDVRAGAKLGTLLFLHIQGETRESLSLQSFVVETKNLFVVSAQRNNTGTAHVVPRGQLTLEHPLTGFQIVQSLNPDKHMNLPGEYAIFDWQFDQLPWYAYGRVRAQANILYGLTNQTIVHTVSVWRVPPLWFLLLIPSILGALTVILVKRKRWHAF